MELRGEERRNVDRKTEGGEDCSASFGDDDSAHRANNDTPQRDLIPNTAA